MNQSEQQRLLTIVSSTIQESLPQVEQVTMDSRLREDLGLGELELEELVSAVEKASDRDLPDAPAGWQTVGDVVRAGLAAMETRAQAPARDFSSEVAREHALDRLTIDVIATCAGVDPGSIEAETTLAALGLQDKLPVLIAELSRAAGCAIDPMYEYIWASVEDVQLTVRDSAPR